ncbi:bifunctional diguanylate cyclase/phosphodiesterase [Pelagibaculum spongiae]|uniref:GGDEF domain-containing protein n=1 Tax=Pelagibaculum spongiae TaxID=2080658 RepID=A0A2V1GZT9_9GAMM|nr:EAL domain-containing protein [Pelagibaculum spongiae]PVZ70454.1 GGDEF domain-containing protein [Pelagibaculum spongiae]
MPIFSLKWKALIITGVLMLCLASVLGYHHNQRLSEQVHSSQRQKLIASWRQAERIFKAPANDFQQLAPLVAKIDGLSNLLGKDVSAANDVLQNNWMDLQLHMGLSWLSVYDRKNQLLAWTGESHSMANQQLEKILNQAAESESVVSRIACQASCFRYGAIPLLLPDGRQIVMLLGSPLTSMVLELQQTLSEDLVLLVDDTAATGRELSSWKASVIGLTHQHHTLPLLLEVSHQWPQASNLDKGSYYWKDNRTYNIHRFPLPGFEKGEGWLLLIDDVTEQFGRLKQNLLVSLLTVLAAGSISLILLVLLLWRPLARISEISLLITDLTKGKTELLDRVTESRANQGAFKDESDLLLGAANELTNRMNLLHGRLYRHVSRASKQRQRFKRQKRFINGILDSAPFAILAQDASGRIIQANHFVERLSGLSSKEIEGRLFIELMAQPDSMLPGKLQRLLRDQSSQYEHECQVIHPQLGNRLISWQHVRLSWAMADGAQLLSIGRDVTESKQAREEIAWLASHDSLTGLMNRRRFEEELERCLAIALRYNHIGALLVFDLDQFKEINDSCGHHTGDLLLRQVADLLKSKSKKSDLIARLGGDEFALVIQETTIAAAGQTAEEILKGIEQIEAGPQLRVSCSLGVVMFPQHGETVQDLMSHADIAMYQAKHNGRGRWHLFDHREQGREQIQQRMFWKEKLHNAMEQNRIMLYFQPILPLASHLPLHYEALMRVKDENGQILPPGPLIIAAEQSGLISKLDHYMLKLALDWLGKYDEPKRLALNLSAHSIQDPELLPLLKKEMARLSINPSRLIFELTETAAVANIESAREMMEAINALGCQFALDDFGVGFSSFYYFKQLPLDYVKIDGAFIRQLTSSREDQALVRALVEVARGFGKKTVAEYVEDKATLELLRQIGVDYVQGYYIGRPQPTPICRYSLQSLIADDANIA